MRSIAGATVVTAAEMRAAEALAVSQGLDLATLMDRAGEGVAQVVRRLGAGNDVMVLCGPGNNGGDGWVAAATLARHGYPVRVAAPFGEPGTDLARAARARWTGPLTTLGLGVKAPVVVDALFGTGLTRSPKRDTLQPIGMLGGARLNIAVDVPSGVNVDTGENLAWRVPAHLTLALEYLKPAHLLQPGAARCGTVRVLPLGLASIVQYWQHTRNDDDADYEHRTFALMRPRLSRPGPDANKFSRGMVAVVPGPTAGASVLASIAAMRAGAGYLILLDGGAGAPHALVRKPWSPEALADPRIGAVLIGNGLGRDDAARAKLDAALACGKPLVIDADALHLVTPEQLAGHGGPLVLTPHHGEFTALFGDLPGSKLDRAREAARRSGAVVVYKGADTVIAAPDGRAILAGDASDWLSTAGTGDVLAGATAGLLASKRNPFVAAAAAVWLNAEAARRLGPAFIADDLAQALTAARASL